MSNLFLFMFVIAGILVSAASSGAVFLFMKKKLDAEIEKEKKLEIENKNGSVVRNLTPDQAKGIQDIMSHEAKPAVATNTASHSQTAAPVLTTDAVKKEEEAKHVRQAFPGTALPGNANPKPAADNAANTPQAKPAESQPATLPAKTSAEAVETKEASKTEEKKA